MDWVGVIPLVAGVVAILVAAYLAYFVSSKSPGNKRMKELMNSIHRGAMTFLNEEYKIISIFVVIVMAALLAMSFYTDMPWEASISFLVGAIFSALAGNIGMRIATKSNARAAEGVKKLWQRLENSVLIRRSYGSFRCRAWHNRRLHFYQAFIDHASLSSILFAFGFGASSIALFARVGGGIYTKSADVGADIVGKVEAGIPEDDPRNPAVIADNVGDNVGDVAGWVRICLNLMLIP